MICNTLALNAGLSLMSNFTYKWKLTDLKNVEKNNYKVFSCFACGGGSTMGYKMSGFDVIGCNEIDPEMMQIYKLNHNPKYSFLESIETLHKRDDLPKELFNLDILDGSPPCSSFSMAGSREKAWGKKKKFREGQADQVLDDLFFHYIELARKLQPKVVVAENVKGILQGNAKGYVKMINNLFNVSGYNVQLFLLNGASMGLPQKRERVFFVCNRKDLELPKLKLGWNMKPISIKQAFESDGCLEDKGRDYSKSINYKYWLKANPGESFSKHHPKGSLFGLVKLDPNRPSPTLTATNAHQHLYRWDSMSGLTVKQCSLLGSFPLDYKFKNHELGGYQIGMSVPPLMMHRISKEIQKQWLDKLGHNNA
jgi:DNA (cytosine-5)-methyltransferase 1